VLHTLDDAREGYERLAVVRLGVVAQIDEDLRGPPVGDGERERDGAADVGLLANRTANKAFP
jgi:hypothetical protein